MRLEEFVNNPPNMNNFEINILYITNNECVSCNISIQENLLWIFQLDRQILDDFDKFNRYKPIHY